MLAGSASADLVLHWALDDGAGTVATDSSGNGRDGDIGGTPNWVEGVIEGALDLDGSSNYIDYNEEIVTGTCSVALWLMPRDMPYTTDYRSIFHVEQWNAGSVHGHLRANTSLFNFDINGGGAVTSTTEGVSDEWYHLAGTFDLETDTSRIYVNGVMEAEGSGISGSLYMGPLNFGAWTDSQRYFPGIMDDIRIYDHALTEEDIPIVMLGDAAPELASNPVPDEETTDIPRDVTLEWTAGEFAVTHDVYLGTVFDDVNNASRSNPLDVLVSEGQSDAAYTSDAVLTFGETYYWRIDEVNGAPDNTIFKGEVWSFTVEPFAYAVADVVATSNGTSDAGVGPERAVDGSGLNENDEHSTVAADMWLTVPGADPLQVQYEFDGVYKLHEMLVWNYNVQFELMLGFGLKDVTVEYSENGADWTALGDVQLAQATARADYAANSAVAFGGVAARSVRMTVNSGYGPMGQFGLSEVRFMFIPVQAREPQPADGEVEVLVGTTLGWRAGREAVTHDVYLGTDPEALAMVDSVSEASYAPSDLQFGTMYYWQIVEVNEAEAVSSWAGDVWDFTAQAFAVIDDMESYDDEDNRIYDAWLDGFVNGTGSTVGYFEAPFAEKTIVNSGSQSMPLEYDNSVAPFYSEAELDLGSADWTTNGADTLRLFVAGQAPSFLETADGTIIMNAIGTDIWDNADEFRFAYKQLTGNGSLVALVEDLDESPNTWVKAGVMIRQSTDAGSTHSFMPMTGGGGNGASWQGRLTDNASSENTDATDAVTTPYWVRIDRAGDSLTGFISPDGQTWTQLGNARSIAMTDPVLIGLALTSHNSA
ncbi:MAG: LamG-like jellyroll fold domain-containing protein, partial [Planctomycetota bacterium]